MRQNPIDKGHVDKALGVMHKGLELYIYGYAFNRKYKGRTWLNKKKTGFWIKASMIEDSKSMAL